MNLRAIRPSVLAAVSLAATLGACGGDRSGRPDEPQGGQAGMARAGMGGSAPTAGTAGRPGVGGAGGTGDGTAGAAGTAAPVDAGIDAADAAGPGPCPSGALLCDDFESYEGADLRGAWKTQVIGGSVEVDGTRPYRGGKAVHVKTTLSPPDEPKRTHGGPLRSATIIKEGAPLFPIAGNAFYGRVMIWLEKMPSGGVHFSNIEALGRLPDGTIAKYGYGGMFQRLMAGYTIRAKDEFDLPTVDCATQSMSGIPEKRWVCVEWQFDGANDRMRQWFDGVLQTGVNVDKTAGRCSVPWRAPTFDKLYLGWRHSQPSTTDVEMWMDDVVIDTKRVGCPAAS